MRTTKSEWPLLCSRLFSSLWSSHGSTVSQEQLYQMERYLQEYLLQRCIRTHAIFFYLCTLSFMQGYDFSCINLNKLSSFNVSQHFTECGNLLSDFSDSVFKSVFFFQAICSKKWKPLLCHMFPIRCPSVISPWVSCHSSHHHQRWNNQRCHEGGKANAWRVG